MTRATLVALAVPVAVATAAISLPFASVAGAEPRSATVNTGSGDLNVRAAPSANSPKITSVRNRAAVVITCYARGEPFSGGPYRLTTDIWNQLDTGGFVTDAMLDTGSNDPVVPSCSGETPAAVAPARTTGQTARDNTATPGTPTWGALAKWFQVSGNRYYPAVNGQPKDLANSARATGWTVVDDPQARAIVVFQPGVAGAPPTGSVAWVDSLAMRPDGEYICITEMPETKGKLFPWTSRKVKAETGMSYILLP